MQKAVGITLLLFSGLSLSQQPPGYNIYLTNQLIDSRPAAEPMTRFDCSDRIHLVVTAVGLTLEPHELKVRWLDPRGNQKELTRYKFTGIAITQVWAWLQLHGTAGAIVGQMFDPSYGMEEFIGEWIAEVYIDGKKVASPTFRVLC